MSSLNVKGCQKYKSWGENQHIFIRKEHYSEFAETKFLKKEPGIAFAFHAMFELLSERMYVSHCLVLFCINLHPPQVDTAGLSLSNTTTKSILHNIRFSTIVNTLNQGGKIWQPFGKRKNGHKTFVRRVFAIFATNSSFLGVIANLQI